MFHTSITRSADTQVGPDASKRGFWRQPRGLFAGLALGAMLAAPLGALAQNAYPTHPVKIVLGFSAGGGTDAIARKLAESMSKTLGANMLIDNKPGANGNIAGEAVSRSAADGYTLLYNTSSIASSPALYGDRLNYDVSKDFRTVGRTASLPIVLVVPANSPFKTVQDFVAYLKANPGKLNYGSAGMGNVTHLAALTFEDAVGIKGSHIPYKGEAPAIVDLMAGHIDYYLATSAGAIPAVQSGRLRALAVATAQRLETLPDVPTMDETVAKGLEMSAWSGVLAPAGTPDEIITKLNGALNKALKDDTVLSFFNTQSAQANPSTPDEYAAFLKSEITALSKIIKAADIVM
ncbi:tripartite tricarboxylate transporter substrate binding protein [Alcaligenaceae bacterium]|nr:tripartite tricarboxylate transporter substrate binding protein [Alcaligenaceae bacterium]